MILQLLICCKKNSLLFIFLSYIKVDLNYCSHQAISSQLEQGVHPKDDSILILTKYRLQLFVNVFNWLTMKAVPKISFKQSIHSVTELFHSRIPNNSFKRLQQCLLTISALSSVRTKMRSLLAITTFITVVSLSIQVDVNATLKQTKATNILSIFKRGLWKFSIEQEENLEILVG